MFTFELKKELKATTENAFLKISQPSWSLAIGAKVIVLSKDANFQRVF